jgi:head-tail adaptor
MEPGKLRFQATILKPGTVTRDSYGGRVIPWVPAVTLWAELDPYRLRAQLTGRRQAGEVVVGLRTWGPQAEAAIGRQLTVEGGTYYITELDASNVHRGELYIVASAEAPASPGAA